MGNSKKIAIYVISMIVTTFGIDLFIKICLFLLGIDIDSIYLSNLNIILITTVTIVFAGLFALILKRYPKFKEIPLLLFNEMHLLLLVMIGFIVANMIFVSQNIILGLYGYITNSYFLHDGFQTLIFSWVNILAIVIIFILKTIGLKSRKMKERSHEYSF